MMTLGFKGLSQPSWLSIAHYNIVMLTYIIVIDADRMDANKAACYSAVPTNSVIFVLIYFFSSSFVLVLQYFFVVVLSVIFTFSFVPVLSNLLTKTC